MEKILNTNNTTQKAWFFFVLLYLVMDYGRPQDILSIGFMRPAMIVILVLTFFILTHGEFHIYDSKQTKMVFCFILLLCIYVPFVRNNYFAWIAVRNMLLYVPLILSTIGCVNSIFRLRKMVLVLMALMTYVAIYSIFHHGMGSGNYFKDENDLSLYINTFLPFCYFLFFYENKKIMKIFYASALIIGVMSIVKSFSRGGFIGLLSVSFVLWINSSKKIISLIIICSLGALLYFYAGEKYWNEMSTITETSGGTAQARLASWESAWKMFLDNPLGVGGNNFPVRFPEYQSEYFERGMWGRAAHSLWFTLLAELGVFGVIIYLSLLYYNIKDIFFLRKLETGNNRDLEYICVLSLAILVAFVGYFASGTFLSVLYYPHYWYLTALLIAMKRIVINNTKLVSK